MGERRPDLPAETVETNEASAAAAKTPWPHSNSIVATGENRRILLHRSKRDHRRVAPEGAETVAAMAFLSELGEVIHEEHFRMLVMVCELENRVKGADTVKPVDARDPEDRALLLKVIAGLEELIGHNAFEEAVLFPAISETGDEALTGLIAEEHFVVEPLAQRLQALSFAILTQGTTFARWTAFREAALELAANLILHLETEEVTVVQRLKELLDPELDHELALRYLRERCRARAETDEGRFRHGVGG